MEEKSESSKTSLASLTENLIMQLKTCEDIEIELAQACKLIDAPKRRLYDVVNVLQGVGLIERCGKSKIKWAARKSQMSANNQQSLLEKEKELTQISEILDQYLDNMLNSDAFAQYAWVSDEDVMSLKTSPDSKLFALKGPKTLSISLDTLDNGSHQMHCHADDAPISWISIGRNAHTASHHK